MRITESIPETLSTHLLDNALCGALLRQLNDFENMVFGPDFACDFGAIQPWVDSGCLFYSAVCGEAVPGRRRILSLVSVFITTCSSRDRMLAGEIADFELTPWLDDPSSEPAIYFSSVVSDSPQHLAGMYASLLNDLCEFRDAHGLNFHSGFSISTGPAGLRHMARNGFQPLARRRYRGTYEMLVVDARSAAAEFWRILFDTEMAFLTRAGFAGDEDCADGTRSSARDADSGDIFSDRVLFNAQLTNS